MAETQRHLADAEAPCDEKHLLSGADEFDIVAEPPSRAKIWRPALAAVGAVGAILVVAAFLNSGSHIPLGMGRDIVGLSYSALATCYGFTGGTCHINECKGERNSQCVNGQCVCVAKCAGADGNCHVGQNKPVKVHFALKNKKYSKYWMYVQSVSAHSQLKTTKWASYAAKYYFSLYELPQGNANKPHFIMNSEGWPTHVNHVAKTGLTTAVSNYAFYTVDLSDSVAPEKLALSVCYNRVKDAIMLGDKDWSHIVYIHSGSWLVYAYSGTFGDVGDGGLWTTEPALTTDEKTKLPPC